METLKKENTSLKIELKCLRRKLKRLETKDARRLIKKTEIDVKADKNNKKVAKRFINCQLENWGKKNNGKRFNKNDKYFALSIFKRGPRCYDYLRHFFSLPSRATLTSNIQ